MDIENMRMTAGVVGNMSPELAMRQPEIRRALDRGAVIGQFIMNGEVYENGIGAWEYEIQSPDGCDGYTAGADFEQFPPVNQVR